MTNYSNKQNNPLYCPYSLRKRSFAPIQQGARNDLLKNREQPHLLTPVGRYHHFVKDPLYSNAGSSLLEKEIPQMQMSNYF